MCYCWYGGDKKMTKKLIKNAFKCLYCNDIIESKHQHHFISCKCRQMDDYAKEHNGMLVAFWDKQSKGTKGMIDYATKIGLKSVVVYYNVEVSDDKTD